MPSLQKLGSRVGTVTQLVAVILLVLCVDAFTWTLNLWKQVSLPDFGGQICVLREITKPYFVHHTTAVKDCSLLRTCSIRKGMRRRQNRKQQELSRYTHVSYRPLELLTWDYFLWCIRCWTFGTICIHDWCGMALGSFGFFFPLCTLYKCTFTKFSISCVYVSGLMWIVWDDSVKVVNGNIFVWVGECEMSWNYWWNENLKI